ncbi:MAG: phosphopentomutase [Firmicutes bacterium]|jgi:phosphopentomutase|nr:phosphopentomutase [Bacillota bacterium]NLL88038.1 phosphopentomutase [Bacillota bacterium]HKM17257.1 phosphopentomutase [Limnochordia bacterium]
MSRFVVIVLDSVGIGELPDAWRYGDQGSNTLANLANAVGGLELPNLERLGLGNIHPINGVLPQEQPMAAWGKMAEQSPGKDTTTGHWEIAGIILDKPFPTYPNGFPAGIIDKFSQMIGKPILGNTAASGTEIIQKLGPKHLDSGAPIVYTSADSVFQIAAHEHVVPLETLYEWCQMARSILYGEHGVGRVIARPFLGVVGDFRRTQNRKDFSLPPVGETVFDYLAANQIPTTAIGKIWDVFAGRGIHEHIDAHGNQETLAAVIFALENTPSGLIFANLGDFDTLWGHRNDVQGYAGGLREFDQKLPYILGALKKGDVLCITADHGCDPTTASTDHSREYVPILVYGKQIRPRALGTRSTFSDIAQTISEFYNLEPVFPGESFLRQLHPVSDN